MSDYDFIILSETWLYNGINENELDLIPNYSIFCYDKGSVIGTDIRGGGVLITVKSHIHCHRILLQNNNEQLFVKLSIASFILSIGAVYIPLHSDINVYNTHTDTVNNLLIQYCYYKIITLGDYISGLHWLVDENKIVSNSLNFTNLETNVLANFLYLNLQ